MEILPSGQGRDLGSIDTYNHLKEPCGVEGTQDSVTCDVSDNNWIDLCENRKAGIQPRHDMQYALRVQKQS